MKDGQQTCKLGEIAELYDSLHQTPKYVDKGYPMIRVTDIRRGFVQTVDAVRVDEKTYVEFSKKHKPQVGDILFSRVGSYGNSAYVNRNEEFCLGQNTVCISPKRSCIDPVFLYCALNSGALSQQIESLVGGASQGTISLKNIRKLQVPTPPMSMQRRIAGILSAYDDLIENNLRRIKILEEMARLVYREWFVNFRFPGHEKVARVASTLGNIPKGWEIKQLSEFITTKYGYTESTNAEPVGPKYLRGMDINKRSFIDWSEVPYCPITPDDHEDYRLRVGDVVVIRMADPGKVGIVEQEVDAVFASYLIRVAPRDNRLRPYFLFYLLESAEYYAFITGASTGTTRKSASAGVIAEYQFVLPPQQLVDLFEVQVGDMRALLTSLLNQMVSLRRTRDLLLPRLLSGQVSLAQS